LTLATPNRFRAQQRAALAREREEIDTCILALQAGLGAGSPLLAVPAGGYGAPAPRPPERGGKVRWKRKRRCAWCFLQRSPTLETFRKNFAENDLKLFWSVIRVVFCNVLPQSAWKDRLCTVKLRANGAVLSKRRAGTLTRASRLTQATVHRLPEGETAGNCNADCAVQ
jgi:hypothetical protein